MNANKANFVMSPEVFEALQTVLDHHIDLDHERDDFLEWMESDGDSTRHIWLYLKLLWNWVELQLPAEPPPDQVA